MLLLLLFALAASCSEKNDKAAAEAVTTPATSALSEKNKPIALRYYPEQLDNTRGLSNSSVNCIFQDSQNLTWIGTWDGLNRYDGNSFRIFRPDPSNKNSLSNQVVLKLDEDNNGQLWVLTMHGINRYDKNADRFYRYYFSRANTPPVSESEFNMALDAGRRVYCAVKDWGVGYFDGQAFRRLGGSPGNENIKKMEFSGAGRLILLSESNELHSLTLSEGAAGGVTITGTRKLATGVETFEILTGNQICTVSTTGEAIKIDLSTGARTTLSRKVTGIAGKVPNAVLFSGKSGYALSDLNGHNVDLSWLKHIAGHKVTTLVPGSEGVVWAGTDGDGLLKIYPLKKSFSLVSKNQLPGLDGGIVRTFLKTSGAFWIGTKGRGLFRLPAGFLDTPNQPLTGQNFNENNSSLNNAVYALSNLHNLVLIGTDGEGVALYNTPQQKLVAWKDIAGSGNVPYFRSVYSIYTDPEGYTWLGTNGYGLIRCRISEEGNRVTVTEFRQYIAGNAAGSLSSNIIFSILPRDNNTLWIGTRLGGLNLFNKTTGAFTSFKNIEGDANSLLNNDILCMVSDEKERLWIGTSFGLSMLQSQTQNNISFRNYTIKDGLPNNTIHGIVPVNDGNLWLSTNMGLTNFSTSTGKFTNYSRNEGLQNNEFSDGAFYCDSSTGYIFMGGIKGFNYFLPEQITESHIVPDLFIDRISGHNQLVPYYQSLVIKPDSKTHPLLVLKHDQNFFDIHLSALTYISNEKCRYAYQLKGFDKGWNPIDNRKIISFTNVPKGSYTLLVKWSNSDGIWTNPVTAIAIRIRPVWWQSDLAILIYVVLGALFILFVRSYYLKRQSLSQNILIRQKEEELHENRLSFFTNIAHEFLTPLTLIVGPAQKIAETTTMDQRNGKYLHMIQRNASRLLFLTQQLLEFRKAEYDYLENTVRQFDLVSLIEQIAELFDDWALDKEIDYQLSVPASLQGWYDKDKLEKIIFNLMSNAFKYTPAQGRIKLTCALDPDASTLNITITNTGKGIPREKMDSLFDRFFLADAGQAPDTEMFRTGIGLAYIKKLVTVLRGEINVLSIEGGETTFTILLPCSRDAFHDKEIDPQSAPVAISGHLKNILEEIPEKPEPVPGKILALDAAEDIRKKVLVVEDEKEIHAYLHDLLADRYVLLSAYNGAEALKIMEHEVPDIIISDVMMPVMDGVEFCIRVKGDIRYGHIPFIMLTAKSSVQHRIEGLESGANSYIPKPFYPDHLLVRIQKLLEEKERILKYFTQDTLPQELSPSAGKEEKTFARTLLALIRKNLENENLDSSFLEKELGISASQLYRKSKELFNLAPGDLVRTIRLKYAAELLRKNEMTVSEVCYKSGFNNRSYFYREFKKVYETTPKSYQLQYKPRNASL